VPLEAASFRWFFEATYERLCQAMYLLTGDAFEAEDLAQESMTRALERWERVGAMESPAGYVYRTALNLNRKRIRRLAVGARRALAAEPAQDPSSTIDARQDVRRALAKFHRASGKRSCSWTGST